MTISAAFQNAMSGLRVAARGSEITSGNISNATTPGYARRTLEVSSTTSNYVGGVTVDGVVRNVDPILIAARRDAQADLGYARTVNDFLAGFETSLGTPDNPFAITNLAADLDASLLASSSRPDSPERLLASVDAARDLALSIQTTSRDVSRMRSEADAAIGTQVERLNTALQEVEQLNLRIAETNIAGLDDSALLDLRQNVIDEINEIVPVREALRDNGKVALYSFGGVILLDGNAAEVSFAPANQVTPYMTLAGGQLSGLEVNGRAVRTDSQNSGVPGGTLAAQFAIRDELGVDAMVQIDATARNLIERFQSTAVDGTLLPGDAGLFTDGGVFFDPVNEIGIAERLVVNAAVDPDQGGEVWRLRDGLGAAVPGAVGNSTLLDNLRGALSERQFAASGNFGTGLLNFLDLSNNLMSRVGVQRLAADKTLSFSNATFFEMSQAERAAGVDTDQELQNLMLIEQNYAANARVIQVVETLMDILMRLGE